MKKAASVLTAAVLLISVGMAAGADFDGNGRDDIAVFRPATGLWAVRGITRAYFGGYGDIPAPGKWSQSARDEIAVFRPSNGLWATRSGARNYFGSDGDVPVIEAGGSPWLSCSRGINYGSGFVGIGINPQFNLDIHRDTSYWSYLRFTNTTTGTADGNGVLVGIDPNEDFRIHSYEANDIKFYTDSTERMRIADDGDVGIQLGGEDAYHPLHVREEDTSGWTVLFENLYDNYLSSVLCLRLDRQSVNPGINNWFLVCKNGAATIGGIRGNGSGGIELNGAGADFAEYLPRLNAGEEIESGDLVGVTGGRISKDTGRAEQVQVVSTGPIVSGNYPGKEREELFEKVAFLGRAPARVRGPVRLGDFIVPSGRNDGVGMAVSPDKLTPEDCGRIAGRAWESSQEEGVKLIDVSIGLRDSSRALRELVREKDHKIDRLTERVEALERLVKESVR